LCVAHFVGPFLKEWAVLLQVVGISALSSFRQKATGQLELSERLSSCLDTYGIEPAATAILCPAFGLHHLAIEAAPAILSRPV
jgi:hypothetical protein